MQNLTEYMMKKLLVYIKKGKNDGGLFNSVEYPVEIKFCSRPGKDGKGPAASIKDSLKTIVVSPTICALYKAVGNLNT